jgi:hypothetical protein
VVRYTVKRVITPVDRQELRGFDSISPGLALTDNGSSLLYAPHSSYLASRGVVAWAIRSLTLARNFIAPFEKKLAACCPW